MDPQRARPLARQALLHDGEILDFYELHRRHARLVDLLQLQYAESHRPDIRLATWLSHRDGVLYVEVGYRASDQSDLPFDEITEIPVGEALDELVRAAPEATAMRHARISKAAVDGDLSDLDRRDLQYVKRRGGKRQDIPFSDGNQLHLIPHVTDRERGDSQEFEARVVSIGAYTMQLTQVKEIREDGGRLPTTRRKHARRAIPLDLSAVDFKMRAEARRRADESFEIEGDATRGRFRFHAVPYRTKTTGELVSLTLDQS